MVSVVASVRAPQIDFQILSQVARHANCIVSATTFRSITVTIIHYDICHPNNGST
jgi:hypothetical protein